MKRASYRDAIDFIVWNDEPTQLDCDLVHGLASVLLVSSIFGVPQERVARDVVLKRERKEAHGKVCQTDPCEHCAARDWYAKQTKGGA